MAEPYNMSQVLDGNGISNLMVAANTYVDNTFGVFALIMIWLVIFIRLKNYDMKVASFTACFITTIISMLFMVIGFINFPIFLSCVLLTAMTALFNKFDE